MPQRLQLALTIAVIVTATVFGGGTRPGLGSDLIVEMISVPLLFVAAWGLRNSPWWGPSRGALALLALILLVPLVQLIPLPPVVWTNLPGRGPIVDDLRTAGVALTWMPLSLAPHVTAYALFALIPPASLFLSVVALERQHQAKIAAAIMVGACANVMLALLQSVRRNATDLMMYEYTGPVHAVGLFANYSHYTAIIYVSAPIAVAWTVSMWASDATSRRWYGLLGVVATIILLAGLPVSYSRAGITLAIVSLGATALMIWRSGDSSRNQRWLGLIAAVLLLAFSVIIQLGLVSLIGERTAADNARALISERTLEGIRLFNWAGSGFGTFIPVYMTLERSGDIIRAFVNHAHNDWLEVTLEGGVLALVATVPALAWIFWKSYVVWFGKASPDFGTRMFGRAATIAIFCLLIHSVVDYPLRTLELASIFAVCCAFLLRASLPSRP